MNVKKLLLLLLAVVPCVHAMENGIVAQTNGKNEQLITLQTSDDVKFPVSKRLIEKSLVHDSSIS